MEEDINSSLHPPSVPGFISDISPYPVLFQKWAALSQRAEQHRESKTERVTEDQHTHTLLHKARDAHCG